MIDGLVMNDRILIFVYDVHVMYSCFYGRCCRMSSKALNRFAPCNGKLAGDAAAALKRCTGDGAGGGAGLVAGGGGGGGGGGGTTGGLAGGGASAEQRCADGGPEGNDGADDDADVVERAFFLGGALSGARPHLSSVG